MERQDQSYEYYHQVYLRYAPMLLKFAEKFVPSFYAEDIVHNVFLKLYDKQAFGLLPENDLKKLLYVSVRNGCIDHLRKSTFERESIDRRALELKLDELDYFESSDEFFMRQDLLELLMKKIAELPDKSRQIFYMSYIEGMKTAEIANQLNLSTRTIENHIYRSLLYLRKHCSKLLIYFFVII